MKVRFRQADRLILSGPPGGWGTVFLLLAVGTVMAGGGGFFVYYTLLTEATIMPAIAASVVVLFGLGALGGGIGSILTRDRLELDGVTQRGIWTRRLLGWPIKKPIEFDFKYAKHVKIKYFTESTPDAERGRSMNVKKVRARLLISKPRRAIVLAEAERQNKPRVREVAQATAEVLGLELEEPPEPGD